MRFVEHSREPELGTGLVVAEEGDRVMVLFANEMMPRKFIKAPLAPVEPDWDRVWKIVEHARELGLIPYREITPEEENRWRELKPLVDEFVAAGSNKDGLESIEGRIYDAFILHRPGVYPSQIKAQLLRWVNTNPSGVYAGAIPSARRLYAELFGQAD